MQHTIERSSGPKPIIIKVHGEPLGVVVPAGANFRFVAVKLPVFPIDGQIFASVEDARAAAGAALNAA